MQRTMDVETTGLSGTASVTHAAIQAGIMLWVAGIVFVLIRGFGPPDTSPSVSAFSAVTVSGTADVPAPADTAVANKQDADTVQLVLAGIPQTLAPGDQIPITGNIVGTLAVDRSTRGDRWGRTLEIGLFTGTIGGQPVENASISMNAVMLDMPMSIGAAAVQTTAGNYELPASFSMPGDWQMNLTVSVPGQSPATMVVDISFYS
jgi:YtkA-like